MYNANPKDLKMTPANACQDSTSAKYCKLLQKRIVLIFEKGYPEETQMAASSLARKSKREDGGGISVSLVS